ncbi:hypothetical protein BH23CHL2_BH23CHL2_22240 [soil metagenome]
MRQQTELASSRNASARSTRIRSRPFGVTAIAFIQLVSSVAAITGWWVSGPLDAGLAARAVYLNSLSVVVAVVGLIVAGGLLLMVRWAWPLALFVLSIQLGVGLWAYYHGHPNYVTMALSVLAIFYLNSRHVRGGFGFVRVRETMPVE